MSKLMAFAASCALFLNACTGPDSTPTTASTAANIVALGDANRNLGTTFTQPPSEIGTGDGFAPQPFVNGDGHPAVMVIAHHQSGLNIGSLDLYTAQKITPLTLGTDVNTSNGFGYVQDPSTKRFYIPTSTNTSPAVFTYSCINGNFKPSLGEQPTLCPSVTPQAGTPASSGFSLSADGLVIDRGAIYGAVGTSNGQLQLTCADAYNTHCNGYPKILATDYAPGSNNVRMQDLGSNKLAIGFNRTGTGKVSAVCFDTATQSTCGRIDSSASGTTSQPLGRFNQATLEGFCAFSSESMAQTSCIDFAGQVLATNITTTYSGSAMYGLATRMPGTGKYMITTLGGNGIECLDMAQAGASCGNTPIFTGTLVNPYGSAFHLNTSTGDMCLLTYNDSRKLGIFRADTLTGQLVEDLRCFAPGGVSATWRVDNPVPGVCPRTSGTQWASATITTGALTLDGAGTSAVYGGDITVLNAGTGQILARRQFAQTGTSVSVPLDTLGISYTSNPSIDIQIRVLQSNGYELRAGHQISAQLAVNVACGP
jgi:hypothetical protein